MAKKVKPVEPKEEHITSFLRQYVEAKALADKWKKVQDNLRDVIKEKITKVNTDLIFVDPVTQEPFSAKLSITTRDAINADLARAKLTPEQIASITKTGTVEKLEVKKMAVEA